MKRWNLGIFAKDWQIVGHPLIWGPFLGGMMLALLAPVDVFTKYPFAEAYYGFIRNILPMIEIHARYSAFPDVTRLYLAVVWVYTPIQVFLITGRMVRFLEESMVTSLRDSDVGPLMITRKIAIPRKYWMLFAGPVLFAVTVWAGLFLGKDPSFCDGCVNASRFGMALMFGIGWPMALAGFLGMFIIWFRNIKKIYSRN